MRLLHAPRCLSRRIAEVRRAQAACTIAQIAALYALGGQQHRTAQDGLPHPACVPVPAAPPGSGAPSAVLGAYDEPEVEPDVSATSSAAARLRERLAAALLMLRVCSASGCTDARCSRMWRSRFVLRLAMQVLPQVPMQSAQRRACKGHQVSVMIPSPNGKENCGNVLSMHFPRLHHQWLLLHQSGRASL